MPQEGVFVSGCWKPIFADLERLAKTNSLVTFCGEPGAGKDILAGRLHDMSRRRIKVVVECPRLTSALVAATLFGTVKGAYTDAKDHTGFFEQAADGTLVLDDLSDLSMEVQGQLLGVFERGVFSRVGGNRDIPMTARIVTTTNRNLKRMAREGFFREDLFGRLNTFVFRVPPLRERPEDVLPLIAYHLSINPINFGGRITFGGADSEAARRLQQHSWPGNVRDIKHSVERALVRMSDDAEVLFAADVLREVATGHQEDDGDAWDSAPVAAKPAASPTAAHPRVLSDLDSARQQEDSRAILEALEKTHWVRKGAAKLLGMEYKPFLYRMKKLGIGEGTSSVSLHSRTFVASATQ